ncbi:MAG: hypothetical protein N3A68_06405 [Bacteroidia bacterium]|jgi:hypothetical protein|nr:hypothetical protein [Bacteroidia bacterium]GIV23023.1 MAG: hypothetical protein KatS3mg025_0682 [Bacteroidia bacterium]
MAQETRTWILLGRRLTVQAPPETITRLESLLATLEAEASRYKTLQPETDELTHWLMATLSLLEALSDRLQRYEAFCARIEALLPPLPSQT